MEKIDVAFPGLALLNLLSPLACGEKPRGEVEAACFRRRHCFSVVHRFILNLFMPRECVFTCLHQSKLPNLEKKWVMRVKNLFTTLEREVLIYPYWNTEDKYVYGISEKFLTSCRVHSA